MRKLNIARLWGRREESSERTAVPTRGREVRRGPFAAGWVTEDDRLRDEPPRLRAPETRRRMRAKD